MVILYAVNMLVVGLAVMLHYECLHRISRFLPRMSIANRFRIVLGVFGALAAHAAEVWIFAIAFFFMHHAEAWGNLTGNFDGTLLDCVYYSFTSYTTLGTGDIVPFGDLRFLAGIESLTGLVLVTWSASFLYLEMTRFWGEQ